MGSGNGETLGLSGKVVNYNTSEIRNGFKFGYKT